MTPFPLPIDPAFRKEVVESWLTDCEDRLELEDFNGAELSWKSANQVYLSLPPGRGDFSLEERLFQIRVKLDRALPNQLCEPLTPKKHQK